jgi:hypothetical protein
MAIRSRMAFDVNAKGIKRHKKEERKTVTSNPLMQTTEKCVIKKPLLPITFFKIL